MMIMLSVDDLHTHGLLSILISFYCLLCPLGVQAFLAAVHAAKQKGADSVVLIFEEPDVPRPRDNSEVPVGGGGGHNDHHAQRNRTKSGADADSDNCSSSGGAEASSSSGGQPKPTRRASTLASGPVLDGDGEGGGAAAAETVGASVFVGTGPGHWGTKENAKEVIVAFLAALQLETFAPQFEVCAKEAVFTARKWAFSMFCG